MGYGCISHEGAEKREGPGTDMLPGKNMYISGTRLRSTKA